MANQPRKFTHIGVTVETRKKISILASVLDPDMYELVETWTNEAWEKAKKDGLVTDAMIQSPDKPSPSQKKSAVTRELILAA